MPEHLTFDGVRPDFYYAVAFNRYNTYSSGPVTEFDEWFDRFAYPNYRLKITAKHPSWNAEANRKGHYPSRTYMVGLIPTSEYDYFKKKHDINKHVRSVTFGDSILPETVEAAEGLFDVDSLSTLLALSENFGYDEAEVGKGYDSTILKTLVDQFESALFGSVGVFWDAEDECWVASEDAKVQHV